jgi:large subunit ribosomal protein L21
MFAIIRTGGKQYKVSPNDVLKIEKLEASVGDKIEFEDVLLTSDGDKDIKVGMPLVEKVKVVGEVVEQGRSKKTIVLKYKSKTRYNVKSGHRQFFTKVKILDIKA